MSEILYNKSMTPQTYLMYHELAPWFHLLTPPSEYADEAELLTKLIHLRNPHAKTLLELGSGGGNLASHLKKGFTMTLVDLSPEMLALSQTINPECRHLEGDMRSFRLDEFFDVVLIEDAIMYITTADDLAATIQTCRAHLNPGGLAVIAPDWTLDEFTPGTSHGGVDDPDGRGMRYLEWIHAPDDGATSYRTDFSYLIHEADGTTRCYSESHTLGIFPTEDWLAALRMSGFKPAIFPDVEGRKIFVAQRGNH